MERAKGFSELANIINLNAIYRLIPESTSVRITFMDVAIVSRIALETAIPESSVSAAVALLQNGAAGPFIARYRREATGGLDEQKIRLIQDRLAHYREVLDIRVSLLKTLTEQGALDSELQTKIEKCLSKSELDDMQHRFRVRKKTRAFEAVEKGLQPLAEYFWKQEADGRSINEHLDVFVDPARGVLNREQALQGVVDILSEWIWENAEYRQTLREMLWSEGQLVSAVVPAKVGQKTKYNMYYDRREAVSSIPSHRVLAIRRGCKEGVLLSSIEGDNAKAMEYLLTSTLKNKDDRSSEFFAVLEVAVRESYNRILRPMIETEVRTQLKERADREAIKVFQDNLSSLLLAPPAGHIVVIGMDMGKGRECSVAVVDETGRFLEGARIRLTPKSAASAGKSAAAMTNIPATSVETSIDAAPEDTEVAAVAAVTDAAPEDAEVAATVATVADAAPEDAEVAATVAAVAEAAPENAEVAAAAATVAEAAPEDAEVATVTEAAPEDAAADVTVPTVPTVPTVADITPEEAEVAATAPTVATATPEDAEVALDSEAVAPQAAILSSPDAPAAAAMAVPAVVEKAVEKALDTRTTLKNLITRYNVQAAAIGAGTNARELENLLRQILTEEGLTDVFIASVNDAGLAIYSSSRQAREEFPDRSASLRCAVSIARRLQDPLSEMVKLDPKLIGVGQYQHDVEQKELNRALSQTVQYCVNNVGVNLNTAGAQLLRYVSGLNDKLARRIAAARASQGPFASRAALKEALNLEPAVYEQAAAFLRVTDGENVLDRTAVHPESYPIVEKMAEAAGVTIDGLIGNKELIQAINLDDYVTETTGLMTLTDIREELLRPGRDPRRAFKLPKFNPDVKELSDLKPDMALEGIVTNVTNFGAFVDIGVRQDGLVHLSQMSSRFIRDPREAVKVGDVIEVRVISVDLETKRIGLSMRITAPGGAPRAKRSKRPRRDGKVPLRDGRNGVSNDAPASAAKETGAQGETASTRRSRSSQHSRGSRPGGGKFSGDIKTEPRRDVKRPAYKPERHAAPVYETTSEETEQVYDGPEQSLAEKIARLQSKFRGNK